jgi:hypothetical protein
MWNLNNTGGFGKILSDSVHRHHRAMPSSCVTGFSPLMISQALVAGKGLLNNFLQTPHSSQMILTSCSTLEGVAAAHFFFCSFRTRRRYRMSVLWLRLITALENIWQRLEFLLLKIS